MQIEIVCGLTKRSICHIDCVGPDNTIEYVKQMLTQYHLPMSPNQTLLVHQSRILRDTASLGEEKLRDGSVLFLFVPLRTGR